MMVNSTIPINEKREFSLQLLKARYCLPILLLFLFNSPTININAQAWRWAKSIGGESYDYGNAIAVHPTDGSVYTTGSFSEIVDFDPGVGVFNLTSVGLENMFISKLDSAGNFVWAKAIGGVSNVSGQSTALDPAGSGGVYTTGYFGGTADFDPGPGIFNLTATGGSDIFISKLDSSGNFVWAKAIGETNSSQVGYAIAIDPAGNGSVYTTGWFSGTVDFDPGSGIFNLSAGAGIDVFISKLDSSGNFVWAKAIGGSNGIDIGYAIAVDTAGSGGVYTTGIFNGTADFDPGAGTFNLTSAGYIDIFISKLDSSGNFVWAIAMGGPGEDYGQSIAIDPGSGDVYTTGNFWGTVDFDPGAGTFFLNGSGTFISKLNSAGNFVWAKSMNGYALGTSIALYPGNVGVYTTGIFYGSVDFDPGPGVYNLVSGHSDLFISKLDGSGNFVWAISSDGEAGVYGASVALSTSEKVYATGNFTSVYIQFTCTTLPNYVSVCYDEYYYPYACYYADIFIVGLDGNAPSFNSLVTNTDDNGSGSLRDIIRCASSGDTVSFSLAPVSQITLTTGEIVIDKHLILDGPGMVDLTISGNNASRIFHILPAKGVYINNLALKNATSVVNGGAMLVEGNLSLTNVLLENNFQNDIRKAMTLTGYGSLSVSGSVLIHQ